MFVYFVVILLKLIILFQIQRIDSLFVSVGDYSNESIPGLNGPECGLNVKPIVFEMSLNNECFRMKYRDKTLVFFDKPNVKPDISQRVFKGEDVRHAYESPWAVYVGPDSWFGNSRICTGVLITPHWVLTAAHCFDDMKNNWGAGVVLSMGSNTKKGTQKIHISPHSFYTHPLFSKPFIPKRREPLSEEEKNRIKEYNDMALIRVSGFIPSTTHDNRYFINTICLPKRDEVNIYSENATFYGYGKVNDSKHMSQYLQKGWVELLPFGTCPLICGFFSKDDIPRTCPGDSGGPLVQYVPGIQSRAVLIGTLRGAIPLGVACSNLIKISYWVPVSKHINWILKTMKENYP